MRIIAFGCSNTYGQGLKDCLIDGIYPGNTPSKFAYPSLLGKKMGIDVINLSKPGNSNKEIWRDVLNFNFEKNDIILIGWTFFERHCVFIDKNNAEELKIWKNDEKSINYFKHIFNKQDLVKDMFYRIYHTQNYLSDKKLKFINILVFNLSKNKYNPFLNFGISENNIPKWLSFKYVDFRNIKNKYPKALDNVHPGYLAHEEFSNILLNELQCQ